MFKANRLQKKYIAFLAVVPLLTISALIKVDCPICNGTGNISSEQNWENVRLIEYKHKEGYVARNACELFILYKYDVTFVLANDGSETSKGWVKLVLKEYKKARIMDIQYLMAECPGETTIESTYIVWFMTGLDVPNETEVHVELVTGEIPDEICDGTGKVPLNTWFVIKFMKDRFRETLREQHEFRPPIYVPPPEEI